MPKAIVLIYRKTEQKGMLRSLPLPENRCRLEREVLPEEVSLCVQAPVAEAEAVLFQEVPVAVEEAVLLRELTVERRVAHLLSLPAHREKKATVLSYRMKQLP